MCANPKPETQSCKAGDWLTPNNAARHVLARQTECQENVLGSGFSGFGCRGLGFRAPAFVLALGSRELQARSGRNLCWGGKAVLVRRIIPKSIPRQTYQVFFTKVFRPVRVGLSIWDTFDK